MNQRTAWMAWIPAARFRFAACSTISALLLVGGANRQANADLVSLGPSVDASNQQGPQSEVGVAVNPLNPLNLVAVVNDIDNLTRLPAYFSMDGGLTWSTTFIQAADDGLGTG